MGMSVDDTCKVVIRMFMEFDLIGNYHIPYRVRVALYQT